MKTHGSIKVIRKNNRRRLIFSSIMVFIWLLSACVPTPPEISIIVTNTEKPTFTNTPEPTSTISPTSTTEPTATPVPIEGRLFFDMNGSGLCDQASFNFDPDRLTDERQPLHPDLLAAVNQYLREHAEPQRGDLITIDEPALSGYTVCAGEKCAVTDVNGYFLIPGTFQNTYVKITDPNAGTPALEMRFINKWNKAVVIPAYEMNGVQVPEQNLNETEVLPILKSVQVGKNGEIGLMQGFRTYTLPIEAILATTYITGYDHDPRIAKVISFTGDESHCAYSPYCKPILDSMTPVYKYAGIFDSHPAYDYFFSFDNEIFFVLAGMPGIFDYWDCNGLCASEINNDLGLGETVGVHGHIYKVLTTIGTHLLRGQILALTGEFKYKIENPDYGNQVLRPHYEFGLRYGQFNPVEPDDYVTSNYKDPFGVISSSVPMNFPSIEVYSSWTVFNLPVYP